MSRSRPWAPLFCFFVLIVVSCRHHAYVSVESSQTIGEHQPGDVIHWGAAASGSPFDIYFAEGICKEAEKSLKQIWPGKEKLAKQSDGTYQCTIRRVFKKPAPEIPDVLNYKIDYTPKKLGQEQSPGDRTVAPLVIQPGQAKDAPHKTAPFEIMLVGHCKMPCPSVSDDGSHDWSGGRRLDSGDGPPAADHTAKIICNSTTGDKIVLSDSNVAQGESISWYDSQYRPFTIDLGSKVCPVPADKSHRCEVPSGAPLGTQTYTASVTISPGKSCEVKSSINIVPAPTFQ